MEYELRREQRTHEPCVFQRGMCLEAEHQMQSPQSSAKRERPGPVESDQMQRGNPCEQGLCWVVMSRVGTILSRMGSH